MSHTAYFELMKKKKKKKGNNLNGTTRRTLTLQNLVNGCFLEEERFIGKKGSVTSEILQKLDVRISQQTSHHARFHIIHQMNKAEIYSFGYEQRSNITRLSAYQQRR